jgi:hypothetical protein
LDFSGGVARFQDRFCFEDTKSLLVFQIEMKRRCVSVFSQDRNVGSGCCWNRAKRGMLLRSPSSGKPSSQSSVKPDYDRPCVESLSWNYPF